MHRCQNNTLRRTPHDQLAGMTLHDCFDAASAAIVRFRSETVFALCRTTTAEPRAGMRTRTPFASSYDRSSGSASLALAWGGRTRH